MTMTQRTDRISQKSLLIFFLLAYGITWGLSTLATENILPFNIPPLLMNLSSILLHYGPAIAAIIMAAVGGGRSGVNALLGRLGQWRVGLRWYLFVFFFPLLVHLATVGIDVLLGGKLPSFFSAGIVPPGNPVLLIPVVFLGVLFQAGLAEEIGWRGYALPGLQQRYKCSHSQSDPGGSLGVLALPPSKLRLSMADSLLVHTLCYSLHYNSNVGSKQHSGEFTTGCSFSYRQ